jgi:hypothetical protein
MIGPQFFLDSQKPYYPLGVGAMVFAFTVMALCGALYGLVSSPTFHQLCH